MLFFCFVFRLIKKFIISHVAFAVTEGKTERIENSNTEGQLSEESTPRRYKGKSEAAI